MCENGETNVSLTESAASHELGNPCRKVTGCLFVCLSV